MTDPILHNLILKFDRKRQKPADDAELKVYGRDELRSALKAYINSKRINHVNAVRWLYIFPASLVVLFPLGGLHVVPVFTPAFAAIYCFSVAIGVINVFKNLPPRWAFALLADQCTLDDLFFLASVTNPSSGMSLGRFRKRLRIKFLELLQNYNSTVRPDLKWTPEDTLTMCKLIFVDRYHYYESVQTEVLTVLATHGDPLTVNGYLNKFRKNPLWFIVSPSIKASVMQYLQSLP